MTAAGPFGGYCGIAANGTAATAATAATADGDYKIGVTRQFGAMT